MKIRRSHKVLLMLLLLANWSFSQKEKIFINESGQKIESTIYLKLQIPDTTIDFIDLRTLTIIDSSQTITVKAFSYAEKIVSFIDFHNSDTIVMFKRTQQINEVTVSANPIRRESEDSTHVVDFHFINGKCYSIQKSIFKRNTKYLCFENDCFVTDESTKLYFKHFDDLQVVEKKDSVFLFDGSILTSLVPKEEFTITFNNLIGVDNHLFYYHNRFFHSLLDEYTSFDLNNEREEVLHLTYDSLTFGYIANSYIQLKKMSSPDIYLYYVYPHPRAGKVFTNHENIEISNLDKKSAQLFKLLEGNFGFVNMTNILEKTRSQGCVLDSIFYLFDFNRKKIFSFSDGVLINSMNLDIENQWYKNEFRVDDVLKKAYFKFDLDFSSKFLEVDLVTGATQFIKIPDGLSTFYHWEISNGRLYFLKNDTNLEWQRVFYSIPIGE